MDLWIRTQDKTTLIRSYEIYIVEQQNMYLIRAKRTSHVLGAYRTFERALEVLDEIQSFIENNYESNMPSHSNGIIANGNIVLKTRRVVYEMPKE